MDTDTELTAFGTTMTDEEEDADVIALVEDLVQTFDDFLWENNGKIENAEPQPDDWSNPDVIYGSQREDLTCRVFEALQAWGII